MNTRPQGLNAIDNVAANKVVQQQPARLGRPPKIRQESQHIKNMVDEMNMEIDNQVSSSSQIDMSASANECRRSSRKKIIKFDVREVLNKNRKSHKVQIEARIDANIIYNNVTSYAPEVYANSFNNKSIVEIPHTSVTEINTTAPSIIKEPAKRGRPRLSLSNKTSLKTPETQTIKRGRGRPRKDALIQQQTNEITKHILPVKSTNVSNATPTPVTVMLKKLNLSQGQSLKVTENSFENLAAENVDVADITSRENQTKVAINVEELLDEENIILELSSSSSSKNESSLNLNQSALDSTGLIEMGTPHERRQRNFASVSLLSNNEAESPEFIVAAVEEVQEQTDNHIEYELVNHEECETISDDSVILMLDLKDDQFNTQSETVSSMELVESPDLLTKNENEIYENTQESDNNDNDSSLNSNNFHSEDVRIIDDLSISSLNERNTIDSVDSVWEESQTTLEDMIVESDSLIEVIVVDEETEDLEQQYVINEDDIKNGALENLAKVEKNLEKSTTEKKESVHEENAIIVAENNVDILEVANNLKVVEQQEDIKENHETIVEEISDVSRTMDEVDSTNDESLKKIEEKILTTDVHAESASINEAHTQKNMETCLPTHHENSFAKEQETIIELDNVEVSRFENNFTKPGKKESNFEFKRNAFEETLHKNLIKVQQISASSIDMNEDFEIQIKSNHIVKPVEKITTENESTKMDNIKEIILNGESNKSEDVENVKKDTEKICAIELTSVLENEQVNLTNFDNKILNEDLTLQNIYKDVNVENVNAPTEKENNGVDETQANKNIETDKIEASKSCSTVANDEQLFENKTIMSMSTIEIVEENNKNENFISRDNKATLEKLETHNKVEAELNNSLCEKLDTEENKIMENAASAILKRTNSHKNSPSPNTMQRKRLEKRYEYVPEAVRPKTVEEIFAEIAAQSSKVALEMVGVTKNDETHIQNAEDETHELVAKTPNNDVNHANNLNENLMGTTSQKKRGRKPKQKFIKSTKDEKVLNIEDSSQESNAKSTDEKTSRNFNKIDENEISPATVLIPEIKESEERREVAENENAATPKAHIKERKQTRWDRLPVNSNTKDDKNQRQIELKEAFQAALSEVAKQNESENFENENFKLDLNDKTLPLMLYKSMSAKLDKDKEQEQTANIIVDQMPILNEVKQTTADPLSDIEKFIADGVNLLKRDYKIMDELANSPTLEEQNKKQCQVEVEENEQMKFKRKIQEIQLSNTALNIEVSVAEKLVIEKIAFETPADTPLATPTATPPPKSPNINLNYGATLEIHGDDSAALRRSHRIKQITKAPKALVGRGLVREKERFALKSDMETKTSYSLDDHLMDLAQVEAKNAKFLKEMEERLSNFQVIKENEYKCERIVSKEARKMICDCFLTRDEESRGELGCGEDCLNRLLMIECGPDCNVKERCTNKRFQKYLCSPCRVFRTEKKGFGIMADIEILPGEFIMEYVGEVIDDDEFERRRTAYSKEKNRHYYFMALRSDAIIDATSKGNISRFINHSCDPNAETQKWTVNGELRIGFFSRKSIMPGEEITFDYQYQRYGREAQRCYCESNNCRGWIGEEPDSDEGEQPEEDSDEDAGLLADDDEQTDEGESEDPIEVQKKLEYAAAAAKLMPISDDVTKGERQKKKTDKLDDEDPTVKFRKLLSKISASVNNKKQKERRGRGRPPKVNKHSDKILSPSKSRFIEDPDIEDEINFLRNCGLKNQSDTLSLSRLMVRAKLPQTRLNLLEVLRQGDEPCRRLFLDYHGLRLLHGWMSEDAKNMNIRLALLQTLMRLPIVNKTVLKESKVLQTVQNWSILANTRENDASPSDESSKESANISEVNAVENFSDIQKEVQELALKLCNIWENLPEIFRIPKRERIEQMKEHEREADRQYEADLAEDKKDNEKIGDEDQTQRDRFRRDLNRYNKRPYSNRDAYIPNPFRRRSGYESDETRHLSKEKRREIFAARVAREEEEKSKAEKRREFEIKCRFFGLHRRRTHPEDVPFYVNTTTGQWYSTSRRPIPTPLNYIHAPLRPKIKSTDPNDYNLPPEAINLPKEWRYAITPKGYIYYYHVKYRRAQWHPPTAAQLADCRYEDTESLQATESSDDDELLKSMDDEVQLRKYLEKKLQARREQRRQHLVTETPISPRRDEDRLYNQQEVRKYKENKEKVRKRKEEIRRKKLESTKQNKITEDEVEGNKKELDSKSENTQNDSNQPAALPIQEYLLSSDDDAEEDIIANSSLLSKIVEGDKIVDELDALISCRSALKRPFALLEEDDEAHLIAINNKLGKKERDKESARIKIKLKDKDKDDMLVDKYEQHKRRKLEKKEREKDKSKRNSTNNGVSSSKDLDAMQRKTKEKFRCEIAGVIVHYLKPYLKSNCPYARITSYEDFNHLARKLTHFVMIKELKYCDSIGQKLIFNESVKNKSREFIRKYMAKYGETYRKPDNDPEFKDIPFTMKHSHEQKLEKNQKQVPDQ